MKTLTINQEIIQYSNQWIEKHCLNPSVQLPINFDDIKNSNWTYCIFLELKKRETHDKGSDILSFLKELDIAISFPTLDTSRWKKNPDYIIYVFTIRSEILLHFRDKEHYLQTLLRIS